MPMKKKKADSPVTLAQLRSELIKFYNTLIEPRFEKIEARLSEIDLRFDDINQRCDDLYKKFEDLLRSNYVHSGNRSTLDTLSIN